MSNLAAFVGSWHPLVVHLPIGALLVAALLEALARTARGAAVRPAIAPIVVLGALSAVMAATTGYLLATSGGYAGATFEGHRRAGLGVAIWSVAVAAAYVSRRRTPRPVLAPLLLGIAVPVVVIAGHLGGTLTYGSGYLTAHAPSWLGGRTKSEARSRIASEVRVYADLVAPVLTERCATCHGGVNPRGDLRLDTPEGIRKGGHSGPALVPGRAAQSEIVRRIWLPPSHKDAMPPGGRHAPTAAEASLLRWWIDQGAPFDATLADVELDPQLRASIEARVGPLVPGAPAILAVKVPPADPTALARVKALGVSVAPIADGTTLLEVHCTNVARRFGDPELAALAPLASQVTWLTLSGTGVSDAGVAVLARFTNLTRLHLDRTRITDAGLAPLAGLARLEYLNLYGTAVTDAGLAQLSGLQALRHLYAWRTAVTSAGAERLRASLPKAQVELGAPQEPVSAAVRTR